MFKFTADIYRTSPDDSDVDLGTSTKNASIYLKVIERAYYDLTSAIDVGSVTGDDVIFYADEPPSQVKQVEKNILAWYQFYDELACGEIRETG